MPQTTLMCAGGDVTFVWDEASEKQIIELIKKKMADGMAFFIVEPRLGGLIKPKRTKVKSLKDLKQNMVTVADADFAELIGAGAMVAAAGDPKAQHEVVARAATPEEVAKSETIAVTPKRGG